MRGNTSDSAPGALAAKVSGRAMNASIERMPTACQTAQMDTSLLALPIQLNSTGLKFAPARPSRRSIATERENRPNTVPSRGSTL